MSIDIRPEFLDGDDPDWFFASGEVPVINMSNGNAASVFDALSLIQDGASMDSMGFLNANQVLAAASNYLAWPSTHQLRVHAAAFRGGLDAARDEAYLSDRVQEIANIARWAQERGRRVEWC